MKYSSASIIDMTTLLKHRNLWN